MGPVAGNGTQRGIWAVHFVINAVGLFLSCLFIYAARRSPVRTSADAISIGVCSTCACLSALFGAHAASSLIGGTFIGGDAACRVASFLLAMGMVVLFGMVGFTAVRTVVIIVRESPVSAQTAQVIVIYTYITAAASCLALGVPSSSESFGFGTYCFFAPDSQIMMAWIVPLLFAAVLILAVSYTWVTVHTIGARNVIRSIRPGILTSHDSGTMLTVVQRQTWVLLLLAIAWSWVAVLRVADVMGRPLSEAAQAALGCLIPASNVLVPVAYAFLNPYQRHTLLRLLHCRLWKIGAGGKCLWRTGQSEILTPTRISSSGRPLGSPRIPVHPRAQRPNESDAPIWTSDAPQNNSEGKISQTASIQSPDSQAAAFMRPLVLVARTAPHVFGTYPKFGSMSEETATDRATEDYSLRESTTLTESAVLGSPSALLPGETRGQWGSGPSHNSG